MKTPSFRLYHLAGSLAVAGALCLSVTTRGATVSLYVDQSLSQLTLAATLAVPAYGVPPTPSTAQGGSGLVDNWGGTIVGDSTGGIFTFSGGSSINALLNPASTGLTFRPNGADPNSSVGGWVWSGQDNYGAVNLPFGQFWYTAYRNLTLDITAGTGTLAGAPASGMTLGFTAGQSDNSGPAFALGYSSGVSSGAGGGVWAITGGVNGSAGNVTWDGTTLTIPVVLTTSSFNNGLLVNGETWTGEIVAHVPEPSSLTLGALGVGALTLMSFRRGRTVTR